jgi:hypothetical protein
MGAKIPPPRRKKGPPPTLFETLGNLDKQSGTKGLSFRVPPEFHREFKAFASQHGIQMLELLKKGFELTKREIMKS